MPKLSPYDLAAEALDKAGGDKGAAAKLGARWCEQRSEVREAFGNHDRVDFDRHLKVVREWVNRVANDRKRGGIKSG